MLTLRHAGEHYVEYYMNYAQMYIYFFFTMEFIARTISIHRP